MDGYVCPECGQPAITLADVTLSPDGVGDDCEYKCESCTWSARSAAGFWANGHWSRRSGSLK